MMELLQSGVILAGAEDDPPRERTGFGWISTRVTGERRGGF